MAESFDASNQSLMIGAEDSVSISKDASYSSESSLVDKSQSAMIDKSDIPSFHKDDPSSADKSGPAQIDKSVSKEINLSEFDQSMQCVMKSVLGVKKEKSQSSVSQFIEQGYDLLDNDQSSINMAAPSLSSTCSLEDFLNLSRTSPIHFYNAYEQLRDGYQRHFAEEKELNQLRAKFEAMNAQKERLDRENNELKQKMQLLNKTSSRQKKEKDVFQKKYIEYKQRATEYKQRLDKIYNHQSQLLQKL